MGRQARLETYLDVGNSDQGEQEIRNGVASSQQSSKLLVQTHTLNQHGGKVVRSYVDTYHRDRYDQQEVGQVRSKVLYQE